MTGSVSFTPYYAVIFTSQRNTDNIDGYEKMAERMVTLAKQQNGYMGLESVRGVDGSGITISYWKSIEDIKAWKANCEHQIAQELGRSEWYSAFQTRVCRVERENSFSTEKIS